MADQALAQLPTAGALTGSELLYLVQSRGGAMADVHTTTGALRDLVINVLLSAMETAGVLSSGQVAAIGDALPGGSIIVPIPGASDGYIGLDEPGNPLGH